MEPSLKNNEIVFIKKFNLQLQKNDIIIIQKNDKIIIKRIIGQPNDIIYINNYVYVNGKKSDDFYTEPYETAGQNIYLNENEYFVLGDNRQYSIDSRSNEIGIIQKNEIIGKVLMKK